MDDALLDYLLEASVDTHDVLHMKIVKPMDAIGQDAIRNAGVDCGHQTNIYCHPFSPAAPGEPVARCRKPLVSGGLCQRYAEHGGHCSLTDAAGYRPPVPNPNRDGGGYPLCSRCDKSMTHGERDICNACKVPSPKETP